MLMMINENDILSELTMWYTQSHYTNIVLANSEKVPVVNIIIK